MRIDKEREHQRLILQVLASRTGLVTLMADSATTTITDARIRFDSPIILVPVTSAAAAEQASGELFVAENGRVNGAAAVTHANNSMTGRTFRYFVG
jgi:hypothetical protein